MRHDELRAREDAVAQQMAYLERMRQQMEQQAYQQQMGQGYFQPMPNPNMMPPPSSYQAPEDEMLDSEED
eukprot:8594703-Alexandrium_andersonii.AAC.1